MKNKIAGLVLITLGFTACSTSEKNITPDEFSEYQSFRDPAAAASFTKYDAAFENLMISETPERDFLSLFDRVVERKSTLKNLILNLSIRGNQPSRVRSMQKFLH